MKTPHFSITSFQIVIGLVFLAPLFLIIFGKGGIQIFGIVVAMLGVLIILAILAESLVAKAKGTKK